MVRDLYYKSGKEKGQVIAKYAVIIDELKREGKGVKSFKLHKKMWTGSYKRPRLVDKEDNYIDVLDSLGLTYTRGNDAPKGGVEGDYIEVKVDRRNKFWR